MLASALRLPSVGTQAGAVSTTGGGAGHRGHGQGFGGAPAEPGLGWLQRGQRLWAWHYPAVPVSPQDKQHPVPPAPCARSGSILCNLGAAARGPAAAGLLCPSSPPGSPGWAARWGLPSPVPIMPSDICHWGVPAPACCARALLAACPGGDTGQEHTSPACRAPTRAAAPSPLHAGMRLAA